MRGEDIFDALGEIDAAAFNVYKKKKNKKRLLIASAVAVIVAMLVCVPLIWGSGSVKDPFVISAAEYPAMVQFPVDMDPNTDEYEDMYMKWWIEKNDIAKQYKDSIYYVDDFTSDVVAQFLSGYTEQNGVISPISLYMALGMLSEVTEGESRDQILSLLGTGSIDRTREATSAVWLSTYRDDGVSKILLSNSMWLDEGGRYNSKIADNVAQYYYASVFKGKMGSESYNERFRQWLSAETGGLLDEYLHNKGFNENTRLALASTVYFDTSWKSAFDKSKTESGMFASPLGDVECLYMNKTVESASLYCSDSFNAAGLALYGTGEMWFVLPDEGQSIDALISDGKMLDFIVDRASVNKIQMDINFKVPKFDVSADIDLRNGLMALGVTDIFSSDTMDQSFVSDNVCVSRALQSTRVKIDEERVEAASVTIMIEDSLGIPPNCESIDFFLDRPFIFFVTNEVGLPLFVGVVNQP